jgi:transcription termination factor Rho
VAVVQYTFKHKQYTERQKNKQYIEQHKKYIEQHKNVIGTVRAVARLGELYRGICLTTEEKARKNLSQGRKCFKHNLKWNS